MSGSRSRVLSDLQWARLEPLLPSNAGRKGHPFRENRRVVEGIIFRFRTGIAWRDLPEVFGPWQTVWTWHRRMAFDGTWDRVAAKIVAAADAAGMVDWSLSVDSRALTPGCGHVESSMGWRKRDDHHHGQEELLDGVSSAGR